MRHSIHDGTPDAPGAEDIASEAALAAYGSYTVENTLLTRHDVRAAFRRLPIIQRVVVALLQRYAVPPGYDGPWPPTPAQVGDYLQATFPSFRGAPVSPRTVVTIHRNALARLRRWLERGGCQDVS